MGIKDDLQGLKTATEPANWSIEHGWAPAETVIEREQAMNAAKVEHERYRLYQQALYDELNKYFTGKREGAKMEQTQWWKPQTAGASVSHGCHLCGAKTVKRTTVEKLRKRKIEGEKRWVWETVITKVFECGTVASQEDSSEGRTKVKVGKECIDISEISDPIEARNVDADG